MYSEFDLEVRCIARRKGDANLLRQSRYRREIRAHQRSW